MPMQAAVLAVGSELLNHKLNTNSLTIAKHLSKIGITVAECRLVGDLQAAIVQALEDLTKRYAILIVTGGLGPTFDDITRECAATVLRKKLVRSAAIAKKIENQFKSRNLVMPPENLRQADVISGAKILPNAFGTAPGQIVSTATNTLALLPGPPKEMIPMLEKYLVPALRKKYKSAEILKKRVRIFGSAESKIDALIRPIVQKYTTRQHSLAKRTPVTKTRLALGDSTNVEFTILAQDSIVDVHWQVRAKNTKNARAVLRAIEKDLRSVLSEQIFGQEEETLASLVAEQLQKKRQTLGAVESCTGGLLAGTFVRMPGASRFFVAGVTAYAEIAKTNILNVPPALLRRYGAVSPECAEALCYGLAAVSSADWIVSITGIAGPRGGSADKPVGTVCFGLLHQGQCRTFRERFYGSRVQIQDRAVLFILNQLRLATR